MPDTVLREAALERIADALDSTAAYQVARRFRPRARYAEHDGTPTLTGLFVDVETTGLDPTADAIIQLALVPFEYSPEDGRVFAVGEAQVHLEDPGRPIPPAVTALTGISDRDVAGRRIDDGAVGGLVADAHLVIAHNAAFDRPMMERRMDVFRERPWACSHTEVPWGRHGIPSAKLEYLLFQHCRAFAEGHRADEDAHAGVHVLATPFRSGERPLALLLAASEKLTVRIWATDAPFGCKAALKARGYRWNPGEDGRPRAWYVDVDRDAYEGEAAWLSAEVYRGTRSRWRRQAFGAMHRFSSRV